MNSFLSETNSISFILSIIQVNCPFEFLPLLVQCHDYESGLNMETNEN